MDVIRLNGSTAIATQTNKLEISRIIKFWLMDFGWEIFFFFIETISSIEPNTSDRFATFEPMTLPITIVPCLSRDTKKVVSISGADVPKAITVEPIRKGDKPNCFAVETEYFSNFSALTHISAIPEITKVKANVIVFIK